MAATKIFLYGPTGTTTTGLSPTPTGYNIGNATLPANSTPFQPPAWASILANRTTTAVGIQAYVDAPGSTAVTMAVSVYVTGDGVHWMKYVDLSLSATTTTGVGPSDGITLQAPWLYVQANITAITGTGAVGNVILLVN